MFTDDVDIQRDFRIDPSRFQEEDCIGIRSIIAEIRMDDDILRRVSNRNGYFLFEDLRPGNWRLKLYKSNLPPSYQFEKEVYEFSLTPGVKKTIEVEIVPKKRRIQFLQEGGTIMHKETQ